MTQVLRGNIIQAPRLGELNIREHGYLNCTPFVRQYDILSNKWGDFICQRAYRTNGIHRSSRNT